MKKSINQSAPVKIEESIIINAPVEQVWNVITNINSWSQWNKDIQSASIDKVGEGGIFNWKSGGMNIQSTIHTFEVNRSLGWSGHGFGSLAIHNWRFESINNQTRVIVEETMEGWLISLLRGMMNKQLSKAAIKWLEALRDRSEK